MYKTIARVWPALLVSVALWASGVRAEDYRYHYVSLTNVGLSPRVLDDRGRIYGSVWGGGNDYRVGVYSDGVLRVGQPGEVWTGNSRGTLGGSVTDPDTGRRHAALFRGDETIVIPGLDPDRDSAVVSLNDFDAAVVRSSKIDDARSIYRVYHHERRLLTYQLPTGSDCPDCWKLNNFGVLTGAIYEPEREQFVILRFRPPYWSAPLVFEPLAGFDAVYPLGITDSGYIGGTTYTSDGTTCRYGFWDRFGRFTQYYEGIFYNAIMNKRGLIVVTGNYDTDHNSYIVPRPGERLDLVDLLDNPEDVEGSMDTITAINRRGDMIGSSNCVGDVCPQYLLERVYDVSEEP
jgi:hypothetical protein